MHACLLLAATVHQWQTVHRQYKFMVMSLKVRAMHKWCLWPQEIQLMTLRLCPCICSHTDSSCWHMWYLAVFSETYQLQYLLMHDKSCFVQGQISLLLAQACLTMMNHNTVLTRYYVPFVYKLPLLFSWIRCEGIFISNLSPPPPPPPPTMEELCDSYEREEG